MFNRDASYHPAHLLSSSVCSFGTCNSGFGTATGFIDNVDCNFGSSSGLFLLAHDKCLMHELDQAIDHTPINLNAFAFTETSSDILARD